MQWPEPRPDQCVRLRSYPRSKLPSPTKPRTVDWYLHDLSRETNAHSTDASPKLAEEHRIHLVVDTRYDKSPDSLNVPVANAVLLEYVRLCLAKAQKAVPIGVNVLSKYASK